MFIPTSIGHLRYYCGVPQKDGNPRLVPSELEPYFSRILELRVAAAAEYGQCMEWPKEHRKERGVYPTWEQIAKKFPVLGRHLA